MHLLLAALTLPSHAAERFFSWSYGVDTLPEGGAEAELYTTAKTHHEDDALLAKWEHQLELEVGITSSLEAGLYLVADQTNDDSLSFSAYKGRLRYRFWPVGSRLIDLGAYLEYKGSPTFEEHEVEAKLLLAHEGDKLRAALNLTDEVKFEADGTIDVFEPTAGVAWRFTQHVSAGLEGKMETELGEEEGPFFWAGPNLHLVAKGGEFWWTLAALGALTPATRADAEIEARSLVGIGF